MRRHVDVLGHGFRFYGMLIMVIMAVVSALMVGLGLAFAEMVPMILGSFQLVFGLALGLPFVLTGRGILDGRPWARTLGLVLSVLMLGDFPIGMSLGVLGLGVLMDEEVAADFAAERPALKTVGRDRALTRARRFAQAQQRRQTA